MSAITLAFPCDHSAAGVLLLGPEIPIEVQIEKVQRWAATEQTPLPGTARLEIWTQYGVRTRCSLPVSAPLAEDAPAPTEAGAVAAEIQRLAEVAQKVPALEQALHDLGQQLQQAAAEKGALSAAVENLTRQLNGQFAAEPESQPADAAADSAPAKKKK